ncbi:hypothetical protein FA13DRAFT_1738567 [Coprinellus micaceus]|uniref:Glycoside hydrolase family 79 protein n=1 Tax=Coprinellus micaceus TaxID=71717 RepID=A0A4Y7SV71_COPMI|nr:hypothetical protein FA13DRAFT_1738567 [Coprinellus micaceus]
MVFSKAQTLFTLVAGVATAGGLGVTVPLAPPSTSKPIAGDHVSFSLEQDRWLDWSGSNSRNEFFFNTLDNLKQLFVSARIVRTAQDFNPGLQSAVAQLQFPAATKNVPYPEASSIVVGDGYFATARFLPKNTRVIWGVNLGANNLTSSYLVAQSIAKAFNSPEMKDDRIVLDGMIIGNEPDLFPNNGHRAPGWNVSQYISEWQTFAGNITNALGITSSSTTKFWGGAFAGSGVVCSTGVVYIDHAYSGSFCEGNGALLQDLMTKANIRGNLTRFGPDIAVARDRGLDYVMGETNSFACHGTPGVSNVAGAALWTLDYLLYGAQVGISRIFFHQGIGFKYNLIQPVVLARSPVDGSPLSPPLPPHIQPQYYAAIIAAEAIGSSGQTRILELTGYAFYEGDILVRALFINSLAFFKKDSTRTSVHIDLAFTGAATTPSSATVKCLSILLPDGRPRGSRSLESVILVSFKR